MSELVLRAGDSRIVFIWDELLCSIPCAIRPPRSRPGFNSSCADVTNVLVVGCVETKVIAIAGEPLQHGRFKHDSDLRACGNAGGQ